MQRVRKTAFYTRSDIKKLISFWISNSIEKKEKTIFIWGAKWDILNANWVIFYFPIIHTIISFSIEKS